MTTIEQLLGDKAESLLGFNQPKISKDRLHLPGPDVVDRLFTVSNRNNRVLGNLQRLFWNGRLAGTGYLSILPVDQGIEHSAGASFAKNPDYFDPARIVELAIAGGRCSQRPPTTSTRPGSSSPPSGGAATPSRGRGGRSAPPPAATRTGS